MSSTLTNTRAWRWQKKPITVDFDFGAERDIGGVRIMSGCSWVNYGVKTASFYAVPRFEGAGAQITPLWLSMWRSVRRA